jgi:hypothetical protein
MYKSFISRKEFNKLPQVTRQFIDYLTIEFSLYSLDQNKNYILTEKGKRESDNSDYLHGNGRPYNTR